MTSTTCSLRTLIPPVRRLWELRPWQSSVRLLVFLPSVVIACRAVLPTAVLSNWCPKISTWRGPEAHLLRTSPYLGEGYGFNPHPVAQFRIIIISYHWWVCRPFCDHVFTWTEQLSRSWSRSFCNFVLNFFTCSRWGGLRYQSRWSRGKIREYQL